MVKIIRSDSEALIIDLERDMVPLSTAGCPKVFTTVRYIVFKRVPKDFSHVDLDAFCSDLSNSLGLDGAKTIIFLTAVDVSTYSYAQAVFRDVKVEVFITFGINMPYCVNIDIDVHNQLNTINIAVIVNKPLSRLALLDLFRTVSEIKGSILSLGGPQCISGISLGTASDATTVVAPEDSNRFAGIATDIGIATAQALIKALTKSLININYEDYIAKTLGLNNFEYIIELSKRVYNFAPIPSVNEEEFLEELKKEFSYALTDPNIQILIRGAKLVEISAQLGLIPSITSSEFLADTPRIIVDELIGKALSEYINGFRGLLAYYWVERLKERGDLSEIKELPPISDDIITALIGSILSKIYDKYVQLKR
jgi:alpha-ribazole phosphatase CobZ